MTSTTVTVAEPEIARRENWTVITLGIGIPLGILLGAALLIVSIILIIKKVNSLLVFNYQKGKSL